MDTAAYFLDVFKEPAILVLIGLLSLALLVSGGWLPRSFRRVSQLGGIALLGLWLGACICPVGALAGLGLQLPSLANGQGATSMALVLLPLIFAVIGGRLYCGSVCPFGSIQEWLHKAGQYLHITQGASHIEAPSWMTYIPFILLTGLLTATPIVGVNWWCRIDPFVYLFTFEGTDVALALMIILIGASLAAYRPWCRYICPYGALQRLAIMNRDAVIKAPGLIRLGGPAIQASSCRRCGLCAKRCSARAIADNHIDRSLCMGCWECEDVCRWHCIGASSEKTIESANSGGGQVAGG